MYGSGNSDDICNIGNDIDNNVDAIVIVNFYGEVNTVRFFCFIFAAVTNTEGKSFLCNLHCIFAVL